MFNNILIFLAEKMCGVCNMQNISKLPRYLMLEELQIRAWNVNILAVDNHVTRVEHSGFKGRVINRKLTL